MLFKNVVLWLKSGTDSDTIKLPKFSVPIIEPIKVVGLFKITRSLSHVLKVLVTTINQNTLKKLNVIHF